MAKKASKAKAAGAGGKIPGAPSREVLLARGRTPMRAGRRSRAKAGQYNLELEIVNRSGVPVPQAFLRSWVQAMAREAALVIDPKQYADRELVIAFVTTDEIRDLNKRYRGKNKPTDVLSFESEDPSCVGELAIAPEVVAKQAREHGLLVREEMGYMILHGFLHLLGYDHETSPRDATRMFKLQDELFERLLA